MLFARCPSQAGVHATARPEHDVRPSSDPSMWLLPPLDLPPFQVHISDWPQARVYQHLLHTRRQLDLQCLTPLRCKHFWLELGMGAISEFGIKQIDLCWVCVFMCVFIGGSVMLSRFYHQCVPPATTFTCYSTVIAFPSWSLILNFAPQPILLCSYFRNTKIEYRGTYKHNYVRMDTTGARS